VQTARQTIHEHLADLMERMRQGYSEELNRYLQFAAQFHHYSFGNLLLALSQRSDVTHLAGLRQWNRLGRTVKPGEKGILILAPMQVRRKEKRSFETIPLDEEDNEGMDEEVEDEKRVTWFKPVYVFDIAQTEGRDLPELIHAQGDATVWRPGLSRAVLDAGIQVETVDVLPGAYGLSSGGKIILLAGLSDAQGFRTLAHEFAHELLHWKGPKEAKPIRETEADATAYVVCRHFGIECDTADYLLLHHAEPSVVMDRLETIRKTASQIISKIEAAHSVLCAAAS